MVNVGDIYNNWIVIDIVSDTESLCECQCENHTVKTISNYNLISGRSKSCGCTRYSSKRKDLVGQHFGDWEVIKMLPNRKCLCKCVCGFEKEQYHSNLTNSKTEYKCRHVGEVGKQFGNWVVLKELGGGKVLCQCQCDNKTIKELYKKAVISGETKSCGCLRNEYKDIVGKQFGEWTVLKCVDVAEEKYLCQCSCENKTLREIYKVALTHGRTKSCGCKQGDNLINTIQTVYNGVYPQNVEYESQGQIEIANYIKDKLNINVLTSCRDIISPYEVDIYIPEKKIAIEFNGNYWHSSRFKDKHYHLDKTLLCAKSGVRLIHIFEYEWENNKDIIKSYLHDTIIGTKQIYARDTKLINVNSNIAKAFIEKNHLQGFSNSDINIGLDYENDIVAMITLGKPRFSTEYQYEIIRMCFKSGCNVVGGAEKMFSAFVKYYKPVSIISYCDLSKFDGAVYKRLGFSVNKVSEPNYVWVKGHDVKTRYQTQKKRLLKQGLGTDSQTEDEIMNSLGYAKIYDCGNRSYVWYNK